MFLLERLREWRIDRMTDRIARRPHGRRARVIYGADDAHSFLWEPVLEALALGPEDRLLDVGCGGGAFLNRARENGCAIAGLDHSPEMVRVARAKTDARVEVARAEAMPFTDGEFTAVSCLVAFFFFPDPVAVLREMRRVLDRERARIAVMTTAPEAKGSLRRLTRSLRAGISTPTTSFSPLRGRRASASRGSHTATTGPSSSPRNPEREAAVQHPDGSGACALLAPGTDHDLE
jgi:SAM-dependent methyltransferase